MIFKKKKNQKEEFHINEFDEDIVLRKRKEIQKRKRMKWLRIIIAIFIVALIVLYFNSSLATVKKISIKGNHYISESLIKETIEVQESDLRILVTKGNIKKKMEAIQGIDDIKIKNNIIQGLVIEIDEAEVIAFSKEDGNYTLLYSNGEYGSLQNEELVGEIQTYPSCSNFGGDLAEFAKKYAKVSKTIRSQFSDIVFSDENADPEKITIYTNDGKIIYCRLKDMVKQLNAYNNAIAQYPDKHIFDFTGDLIYMK